jgi:hypothetical protein
VTHFLPLFSYLLCINHTFKLDIDKYEHIKAIENKMSCAYARLRSTLYRDHYKKHFEGSDAHNAKAIARVKDVGR